MEQTLGILRDQRGVAVPSSHRFACAPMFLKNCAQRMRFFAPARNLFNGSVDWLRMMSRRCTGPAFEGNNQHDYGAPQVVFRWCVCAGYRGSNSGLEAAVSCWSRLFACLVTCAVAQKRRAASPLEPSTRARNRNLAPVLSPAVTDDAGHNCG